MKKLLILLSAGTALALASCGSAPAEKSCCGSCGGDSACQAGCACAKCAPTK